MRSRRTNCQQFTSNQLLLRGDRIPLKGDIQSQFRELHTPFAFVLDNGVRKSESEWKKHLSNAVLEDEIRLVDENEKSGILGLIRPIISEQIAKIESREKQFMDRRKKRLMHVLSRIDDTESHLYRRISKTIEVVDDKFNSMQITDLDVNLIGVLEGRN